MAALLTASAAPAPHAEKAEARPYRKWRRKAGAPWLNRRKARIRKYHRRSCRAAPLARGAAAGMSRARLAMARRRHEKSARINGCPAIVAAACHRRPKNNRRRRARRGLAAASAARMSIISARASSAACRPKALACNQQSCIQGGPAGGRRRACHASGAAAHHHRIIVQQVACMLRATARLPGKRQRHA